MLSNSNMQHFTAYLSSVDQLNNIICFYVLKSGMQQMINSAMKYMIKFENLHKWFNLGLRKKDRRFHWRTCSSQTKPDFMEHVTAMNVWIRPGFHYPSWRVMETGHPSTRAVNSGSGNRALGWSLSVAETWDQHLLPKGAMFSLST